MVNRTRTWIVAAALSALGVTAMAPAAAWAQEEDPGAAAAEEMGMEQEELQLLVDSYVAHLGSSNPKLHEAAARNLVQLGNAAAPALNALVKRAPRQDVRDRAMRVLEQIESSYVPEPTLVTIKMDDAAPDAVLAELSKQAGMRITPSHDRMFSQGDKPATISVNWEKKPFWEALREFCNTMKVMPNMHHGMNSMQLYNSGRTWLAAPAKEHGGCLIVPQSISRGMSIQLGEDPPQRSDSMNMQVMVLIDPKLRVIETSYPVRLNEVTGNAGDSLAPEARSGYGSNSNVSMVQTFHVPLKPSTKSDRITKLSGTVRMVTLDQIEKMEIDKPLEAKDVTKTIGGRQWVVKEVTQNNNQVQVKIQVLSPGERTDGLPDYYMGELKVLDVNGQPFRESGRNGGGSRDKLEYTMNFSRHDNNQGALGKVVWEIPAGVRGFVLPIELTDIPIPQPQTGEAAKEG